jgi:hypothetical protein
VITFGYIGITILALFVSYFYIARIDWSTPVELFGGMETGIKLLGF